MNFHRAVVLLILLLCLFVVSGTSQTPERKRIEKTMRALVKFRDPKLQKNNIFISPVYEKDGRRFAYAYWKEDRSITIMQLPLTLPLRKYSPDYYWLTMNARIDLKHDVVPTREDIGGSTYLVDRPWVNKVIRKCLAGTRLRV